MLKEFSCLRVDPFYIQSPAGACVRSVGIMWNGPVNFLFWKCFSEVNHVRTGIELRLPQRWQQLGSERADRGYITQMSCQLSLLGHTQRWPSRASKNHLVPNRSRHPGTLRHHPRQNDNHQSKRKRSPSLSLHRSKVPRSRISKQWRA